MWIAFLFLLDAFLFIAALLVRILRVHKTAADWIRVRVPLLVTLALRLLAFLLTMPIEWTRTGISRIDDVKVWLIVVEYYDMCVYV